MDYKMNGLDGRIYKLMKREEEKRKLMKNIIGKIKKKGSAYFKIRNVAELRTGEEHQYIRAIVRT